MLEGTKKLFPNDYNRFKRIMLEAANDGELPIVLELNDFRKFTLKDFQEAFYEFTRDTGLQIAGSFSLFGQSGLYVALKVDYPPVDKNQLVQ